MDHELLRTAIAVLGLLLTVAVQTWGIIKFMVTRMDTHKEQIFGHLRDQEIQRMAKDEQLHARISAKVDKDDYHRDNARTHELIAGLKATIEASTASTNARIDALIMAIPKRNSDVRGD